MAGLGGPREHGDALHRQQSVTTRMASQSSGWGGALKGRPDLAPLRTIAKPWIPGGNRTFHILRSANYDVSATLLIHY